MTKTYARSYLKEKNHRERRAEGKERWEARCDGAPQTWGRGWDMGTRLAGAIVGPGTLPARPLPSRRWLVDTALRSSLWVSTASGVTHHDLDVGLGGAGTRVSSGHPTGS